MQVVASSTIRTSSSILRWIVTSTHSKGNWSVAIQRRIENWWKANFSISNLLNEFIRERCDGSRFQWDEHRWCVHYCILANVQMNIERSSDQRQGFSDLSSNHFCLFSHDIDKRNWFMSHTHRLLLIIDIATSLYCVPRKVSAIGEQICAEITVRERMLFIYDKTIVLGFAHAYSRSVS